MLLSASGLPRGIALVRVQAPQGKVVICSDRLSKDELRAAQFIASRRCAGGAWATLVHENEVYALLGDAA